MNPGPLAEGEITRAEHQIRNLLGAIRAIDIVLREAKQGIPVGFDVPQNLLNEAARLVMTLNRLDAYQRAEEAKP